MANCMKTFISETPLFSGVRGYFSSFMPHKKARFVKIRKENLRMGIVFFVEICYHNLRVKTHARAYTIIIIVEM